MLRVADLFCGAGGFSSGFEKTGKFKVVYGIDIKEDRIRTFERNHPDAIAEAADIRTRRTERLADRLGQGPGDLDVVIAGPPCQGFSSIRPHRSLDEDDRRNNLFEQLALFLDFFEPRYLVFENVVGLVTFKNGKVLEAIQDTFRDLGYALNLRILNAVHYGVPQKRERVFILGRRGETAPEMPQHTHHYENPQSMAGELLYSPLPLFQADLAEAVTLEQALSDLPPVEAGEEATEYEESDRVHPYARARRNGQDTLTMHKATNHSERMLEIIRHAGRNHSALPEGMTTSGFSSSYSRLDADEPSTTITVNFPYPGSNRCIHPTEDRAITPREAARLQSFDDDFEFVGSRREVAMQLGEAVPPLVGKAIAEAILDQW